MIQSLIVILSIISQTDAFTKSVAQIHKLARVTLPTSPIALKATNQDDLKPLYLHHTAIRTRDINTAIKFYSLFGFTTESKFRAGPCRAAWIINTNNDDCKKGGDDDESRKGQNSVACRLELIEVPAYILQEKESEKKRSIDLLSNESMLGLNHYALDVTAYIESLEKDEYFGLDQFLDHVNNKSLEKFGKTLRIALKPRQKVIGSQVYELAFLYDADGTLFEVVRYIKELDQIVESGWEPWDGEDFVSDTSE